MENYNGFYPRPEQETPAAAQPGTGSTGAYGSQPAHTAAPYGAQSQSASQSASAPQYPGWEYYNNAWHAVPQQTAAAAATQPVAEKPKKKGNKTGLKVASVMLACLLCGFGGGYAAVSLYGAQDGQNTVVYKAPENSTNGASGVNNPGSLSVSDIAEQAGQSVVSVTTQVEMSNFYMGGTTGTGAGSGVIITEDGYILTNNHVVEGAQSVSVTLPDGSEQAATVVATDPRTDVAVLKIDVSGLVPATIGNSDELRVGEFCLAIGNPMGTLGGTVTNGIVSALDREITIDGTTMNLLQMSAAVSPGNSGGGLFNSRGELIGIVNAKSGSTEAENLGFAIPINTAMKVSEDLISGGYVKGRPGLGITVQTITTQAEAMQAGVSSFGVFITSVNPGSAAEQAGLQVGDKVLKASGNDVTTSDELTSAISELKVGDKLELVIERDGQQMDISAVLGELKN